jgi:hypothetical protein
MCHCHEALPYKYVYVRITKDSTSPLAKKSKGITPPFTGRRRRRPKGAAFRSSRRRVLPTVHFELRATHLPQRQEEVHTGVHTARAPRRRCPSPSPGRFRRRRLRNLGRAQLVRLRRQRLRDCPSQRLPSRPNSRSLGLTYFLSIGSTPLRTRPMPHLLPQELGLGVELLRQLGKSLCRPVT